MRLFDLIYMYRVNRAWGVDRRTSLRYALFDRPSDYK